MAITKIIAIRDRLDKRVNYAVNGEKTTLDTGITYAANPEKTEQLFFTSAINCESCETAFAEMQATKRRFGKLGGVVGYHFIQSFAPGEVTPEQAHAIGVVFARRLFGDRYEVVIGTHLDKAHLHNHVVVNSVSFVDGKKYHSSPGSYYFEVRSTSDMEQKRSALGLEDGDYLLSGDELTYAGSSATDWLPIGLSRCGVEDDYDAYLAALQTYVEQKYREPDKLDRVKATEWHRISLAVLACGGDPTHFGKDENGNDINLIADGVYDRGKTVDIGAQGLNGWLWGLITLDSMKYNIPAGSSYTRTEMIKKILSFQLPDDGFNLRFAQGSTADPDITAMAIQALAPYYRNATFNVKDPVDKALDCLSKLQLDTGDFRSWGTRNSESVSQIIVSLCSIGVDPQNDPRFIKNGINLLDALFYYQQEDGGFAHSYESDPGNPSAIPGESNSIATDQALLALVAVWRQAQGMSILYDFRPGSVSSKILTPEESEVSFAGSYEFTEADQQQADALPKKLSTENDAEVTALLNKLKMSRDFDGYDTYMTKLTQAKSDIDALYAEIESLNADIQEQIISMTEPGLGEKSTVDRLVKRYKALSDHDKELVQNWDTVLAVKAQTDAAQRNLFLIIGGAVVVMVAVTVVVRRRRESK